ncbi:hypothetical protein KBJ94_27870 [Pseudomonas sp. ITA]|uniref:hypothetical protein n=1 Tax=Pseudomonas sp. ITA TaxID=2825841 RepID=UPI002498DECA|nr:hypothetical protein [Pseudomonas sp. ITA]MDI2145867.1 hypothetical protein [Pseudomonas sp. ITA]
MDISNVKSEAFNFSSLSSSVNERTGGVDVSVSLGRISRGLQDPATFELLIYSNPGNPSSNFYGFGGNWLINSPRIDFLNKVIYFGSGKTARYTGNFVLEYRRLKDIRIESKRIVDGSASYWNTVITHKNGTVEYYNELGAITQLVSASGHRLHFTYVSEPGEIYQVLSEVHDDNGNQLSIDYGETSPGSTERVITVTQLVAGERSVTKVYIQRDVNRDIVKSISLPNNFAQRFHFDYIAQDDRQVYLSRITTPTGRVQEFAYTSINYNSTQTIKVVSTLTTRGNNPVQSDQSIVTYEYGNNNFTGYPLVNTQVQGRDNCIYRDDDFTYVVTEVHDDVRFKRTFNRFHLLVSEELLDAQTQVQHVLTSYTYPTVEGQDINAQPNNFSLWTRKTTKYANPAGDIREVYEARTFDLYGNLVSHRDESGLTTTNVYYPADSSLQEGCPPTPDGYYVCHLKRSQIKPEGSTSDMKTLEFKYKKVDGFSYTSPVLADPPTIVRPYMTCIVESKVNGIILSTADYISATENTAATARVFVGMPLWERIPSQDKPYNITYSYSMVGHQAKVQATHRSTDAEGAVLEKTTEKTFSLCSGLTAEERDFTGAITQYQYDAENRLIKKTRFFGTAWQQEEHYSHEYYKNIDATYGYQNVTVTTTATGMQHIHYTDFNDQLTYALEAIPGGEAYCVKSQQYFNNGLLAAQTEYDKVLEPHGNEITLNNTTRYTYAARELIQISHPDGTRDILSRNKVLNTQDHRQRGGARYRTAYDNAGHVLSLAAITEGEHGEITTYLEQATYDGFGRKVTSVNRTGGRSNYAYDNFDRLLYETVHDTDGNGRTDTTTYTYDTDLQNMNLAVAVSSRTSLNEEQDVIVQASRAYDGFGRLIEQDQQKFSYAQPYYDQPSRDYDLYNAANTVTVFDATTLLPNTVTQTLAESPETLRSYSYDKSTGAITQAQIAYSGVETARFQYSYNAKGLLTQTQRTYTNGGSITTAKTYSASGQRVMTSTNLLGTLQHYGYDYLGRLWTKKYDGLGIRLGASYHHLTGLLTRLTLEGDTFLGGSRYLAILEFEYDAGHFESRRTLEIFLNGTMQTVLDTATERGANECITSRNLSKGASATDNIRYAYTALGAYGHLSASTRTQGTASPVQTRYKFAGGQRFSSVETTGQDTVHYNYHYDRVSSLRWGENTRFISSDVAGNLIDGPEASPHARRLNYDASNSLVSCHLPDTGKTYAYRYEPLGNLSQIQHGEEFITYIYDNDTVIGEVSGNVKTLYLSFGDYLLGRYVQRGNQVALEIFGTDAAGTVRSVTTCLPGEQSLPTAYHDYSDFGERRDW